MNKAKAAMSKSRKNCYPIDDSEGSLIPRGTPGSSGILLEFATHLQDRLQVIYGDADPRYLIRLAQRSRTYRELIRRYSNDSML